MRMIAAAADRARQPRADERSGPGAPSGAVHQATLERVLGRIFAALIALMMVVFWSSSATLAGQRPGTVPPSDLQTLLCGGEVVPVENPSVTLLLYCLVCEPSEAAKPVAAPVPEVSGLFTAVFRLSAVNWPT